jgi:hypothetical protein
VNKYLDRLAKRQFAEMGFVGFVGDQGSPVSENKAPPPAPTKPTKPTPVGFEGFDGDQGSPKILEKPLPQAPTKPTKPTIAPSEESSPARPIHPQLRRALVRELWRTEGHRTFLLDTATKADVPLLEACPDGIDPQQWHLAVMALSRAVPGPIPRTYDAQPVIRFPVVE